jgi:hypothetical protein
VDGRPREPGRDGGAHQGPARWDADAAHDANPVRGRPYLDQRRPVRTPNGTWPETNGSDPPGAPRTPYDLRRAPRQRNGRPFPEQARRQPVRRPPDATLNRRYGAYGQMGGGDGGNDTVELPPAPSLPAGSVGDRGEHQRGAEPPGRRRARAADAAGPRIHRFVRLGAFFAAAGVVAYLVLAALGIVASPLSPGSPSSKPGSGGAPSSVSSPGGEIADPGSDSATTGEPTTGPSDPGQPTAPSATGESEAPSSTPAATREGSATPSPTETQRGQKPPTPPGQTKKPDPSPSTSAPS